MSRLAVHSHCSVAIGGVSETMFPRRVSSVFGCPRQDGGLWSLAHKGWQLNARHFVLRIAETQMMFLLRFSTDV